MNGLVKVALAGDGLGDYIFGLDPQLLVDSAITILAMFAMFCFCRIFFSTRQGIF